MNITKLMTTLFLSNVCSSCLSDVCSGGAIWWMRGEGPPNWMSAKPWRRLFLAAYTLWLSLLPCVAHCCMLYTMCNVKQFVLIIINPFGPPI